MTDNLPVKKEDAPLFSETELQELNDYVASGKGHKIEPKVANNFYALYKEGRTIDQIHQAFPSWPKGAILLARHQHRWDEQNNRHFLELAKKVKERVAVSQLEMVNHLMDKLAIVNKEFAKEMEQYLQSPTRDNLPSNRIKSTRELKETIAVLKEMLTLFQMPTVPVELPGTAGASGGKSTVNITINTKESSVVTEAPPETAKTETIIDAKVEDVKAEETKSVAPVAPSKHSAILKALAKSTTTKKPNE